MSAISKSLVQTILHFPKARFSLVILDAEVWTEESVTILRSNRASSSAPRCAMAADHCSPARCFRSGSMSFTNFQEGVNRQSYGIILFSTKKYILKQMQKSGMEAFELAANSRVHL